MDFEVIWSPQVRDDLHGIAAYIAKDSPRYASAVIEKILAAGRGLQFLPWRGRVVREIGRENCRELFIHEYRLIYEIEGKIVRIIAVIHGRRSPGAVFERRPE
ncbi:MAG: type II toxin-antitoxin system RelE/ParE family toxin [Lacunisphaera sp.]|nr:type II toxin-antitoxin system RelE/ParE family toxin [Lacunisphaera sp.]